MLKNSNFDNEFTLSPSEINDYYQEGFVVKDKVFNDNDFISFREGITKSIQNKCDNLINDGKLESDFSYPSGEFNYTLPMDEINLKYRAKYTSATINYVFKWEYKQNSNVYLVYSYYKEINGKNLSGILDVLDYASLDNELTEIFSDKSFFLKWDYWFDV